MRAFTIPLPETIGRASGQRRDGVVVGSCPPQSFASVFERTRVYHAGKFWTQDVGTGINSIIDVSSQLTGTPLGSVRIFPVSPTVGDAFYIGVPAGILINEVAIQVITAMANLTLAYEYWSGTQWAALTMGTSLSTALGKQVVAFTRPADWASRPWESDTGTFIGLLWRIRVTAVGGSPVSPVISKAHPILVGFQNIDITASEIDFDLRSLTEDIVAGEEECHISNEKPWGLEIVYQEAQEGGGQGYQYSTVSARSPLTLTDPSSGMTVKNNQTFAPKRFTATAVNGTAATVQALTRDGYVECGVNALPTATTNKFSIGLSSTLTGNPDYELRADFGTQAEWRVYEGGVLRYTHATAMVTTNKVRIFRFENRIRYYIGDDVIFTSTVQNSGLLYGRAIGIHSGAIITGWKLIDFSRNLAAPLAVTLQSATGLTMTDEASATEQLFSRYVIGFVPPADFVSQAAAVSDVGVAGFHITAVKTGAITRSANVLLMRVLLMGGTGVEGQHAHGASSFQAVSWSFAEALRASAQLLIWAKSTQTAISVTIPANDPIGTIHAALAAGAQDEIFVAQLGGNNEEAVGFGSHLVLQEA